MAAFWSAPISLTAVPKSVHGSGSAPICGAQDLYLALGWRHSTTSTAFQVQTHHTSWHKTRRCGDVKFKTFQTLGLRHLADLAYIVNVCWTFVENVALRSIICQDTANCLKAQAQQNDVQQHILHCTTALEPIVRIGKLLGSFS